LSRGTHRKRLEDELSAQLDDMRRLRDMSEGLVEATDLPKMPGDLLGAAIALQRADFGDCCVSIASAIRTLTHRTNLEIGSFAYSHTGV
jgi:hypothetical protein